MHWASGSSAPGRWWSVIQHAHAERVRRSHAVDAGDAVVDGDQHVGIFPRLRQRDDFGRQTVAVFEAVGHQIIDVGAERAQRAHADRAGGRAVGIVVGDDQQLFTRRNGIGGERRHRLDVLQRRQRRQSAQVGGQLVRAIGCRARHRSAPAAAACRRRSARRQRRAARGESRCWRVQAWASSACERRHQRQRSRGAMSKRRPRCVPVATSVNCASCRRRKAAWQGANQSRSSCSTARSQALASPPASRAAVITTSGSPPALITSAAAGGSAANGVPLPVASAAPARRRPTPA